MSLLPAIIILTALIGGTVIYAGTIYNSLVRVKNEVDRAWANIDVILKQRHDEIPKLISTVESYMQYEKDMIQKVIDARKMWTEAKSVDQKLNASNEVTGALKSLFSIAENYPELKANTNFVQFQQRLSALEDQLADRREFYNAAVNNYNICIEQFPDVVLARNLGYVEKGLFHVEESDKTEPNIRIKKVS